MRGGHPGRAGLTVNHQTDLRARTSSRFANRSSARICATAVFDGGRRGDREYFVRRRTISAGLAIRPAGRGQTKPLRRRAQQRHRK